MKVLRLISRMIIGLVFIFSGTVKAIDPLGTAYKFQDYFQAFHLEFLHNLALVFAILLCVAEFTAGVSVLSGYLQKTGTWLVLMLMALFTPVTLVLAVTNPVSDCGCFGDAIHLTNWQTFGKNVVLLALVTVLLSGRKSMRLTRSLYREWVVLGFIISLFVIFILMNLRYLPVIDFLPYKKGISIPESMKIPPGKPADKYETTFIYEKEGVKKEFNINNYPANDSSWKFIEQKSTLIKKGYQPPIHDFSITSSAGENITEKILSDKGYTVLMISKKLHEADGRHLREGFDFSLHCLLKGIGFYVVTASGSYETASYGTEHKFCTADETTLKTMIRSNPGYILLKEGKILGKWSWAGIPSKESFTENLMNGKIQSPGHGNSPLYIVAGVLSVTLLVLLISSLAPGKTGSS